MSMVNQIYNKTVSFIWRIADECLHDVYVQRSYCDVILPMTVICRLDTVLENTKLAVLEMKKSKGEKSIIIGRLCAKQQDKLFIMLHLSYREI